MVSRIDEPEGDPPSLDDARQCARTTLSEIEKGAREIPYDYVLAHRLRRDGYFAKVMTVSTVDIHGGRIVDKIALPCANDTLTLLRQFEKIWNCRRGDASSYQEGGCMRGRLSGRVPGIKATV
ncbi:MAG: hypothetical protein U0894_03640 [Pirellulales bacterium]